MTKEQPVKLEAHGHVRIDPYYWLRERDNPEVTQFLKEENKHTDSVMAHTKDLQETLFQEIIGRIKKTDESVPYRYKDFLYYVRYEGEGEYAIHCRKPISGEGKEQVLLDVNELAKGHTYYSLDDADVSSGQNIMAYAFDNVGRRIHTIRFRNLETGEYLDDVIENVTGDMAWAEDNATLFYARQDDQTLRSYRIYRHKLGTDPKDDPIVFEEQDDTFSCYVSKTKSSKYLIIESDQTLSTESRILDASNPEGEFEVFLPRQKDHEYDIEHFEDSFYILTNHEAKNFRLMKAPLASRSLDEWEEVIAHREDVLLEDVEIFKDHLVLEERTNGLMRLRVRPWDGSEEHYIPFEEPAYLAYTLQNFEFETTTLRFRYTSLTTPSATYDYDMNSRERTLLKQQEVLGDFDSSNYTTERLFATAQDGTQIPISIVYRKGTPLNGTSPLLLYGYGSYGYSLDATFRSDRLSLLDRGFIYAIAHIRGGEELGRHWYEDGKLLKKKNTFTDFIDCAEFLVESKYADPRRIYGSGGSAGGLLIGAVINMRPDLFDGVIAAVPFVDVVTTMLDETIPLTTSEYDEWGNPNEKQYYDYMLSYSPYDNVTATDYPHLLITTSLHDSQVQYWEPAKWVAKLRTTSTGTKRLLLKTDMEAGHGGASGRFKAHRETALDYAFLLDLAGK